jgi:predicted transport protein
MSFQAYLDTIKAKTGKTVADFKVLSEQKGLTKHGEVVKWLKEDFELGHGHATAMAGSILKPDHFKTPTDDKITTLFKGKKEAWRETYDNLMTKMNTFGKDVKVAPTDSYVSLLKGQKKFAIVQPSSERLDIGIKLKDVNAEKVKTGGRLEPSGSWNTMVTHRVKITHAKELDKEVLAWLKQAYDAV